MIAGDARRFAAGFGILAAAVLLTGCAASASPATSHIDLGPIQRVTSPSQITTPLDAYLPSETEALQLVQAEQNAINSCLIKMGAQGQWQQAADPSQIAEFINYGIRNRAVRSPLWGFFDTTNASQFGYELPTGEVAGIQSALAPAGDPPNDIVSCRKQADKGIAGGKGPAFFIVLPQSLPSGGPTVPADDVTFTKAVSAWSACMAKRGFKYSDPLSALYDKKWVSDQPANAIQIATASADVQCKVTTNLVGIGLAVQSAYDQRYIDAHRAALVKYQNQISAYIKKYASV